ncbi:MAG: hypothetical protein E6G57_10615 [Actinobacteria bacterium]|nr:MAG: hypothetical protein E6G57_10615 [Actinomycetota bacterium]
MRPTAERGAVADALDIAVVRLPRISNFTDLDALAIEPGVSVRLVDHPAALGDPDLVVLPGSKATVADLDWLRGRGFDRAIARTDVIVLGICAGYQMLGQRICDDVESGRGTVEGLGVLDAETAFAAEKVTRQRRGVAMGQRVSGYEIHPGDDGAVDSSAGALGTALHGLFEEDAFRAAFLIEVARRRGKTFVPAGVSFSAAREAQFDRLADLVDAHLDLQAVLA